MRSTILMRARNVASIGSPLWWASAMARSFLGVCAGHATQGSESQAQARLASTTTSKGLPGLEEILSPIGLGVRNGTFQTRSALGFGDQ